MTLELKMLALSIVLGLVHIVLASHAASLQRGYVWTASSRDEAVPALTGVAGRLARALQNFGEMFPLFAAGVLIAHVAATHSWMTKWGVQLYFCARVAYLALYGAGVFLLRSLPSSNVPFMMPARIASTPADQQIKEVVGSGPFKFAKDEWLPGEQAIYVRNPSRATSRRADQPAARGRT